MCVWLCQFGGRVCMNECWDKLNISQSAVCSCGCVQYGHESRRNKSDAALISDSCLQQMLDV